VLVLEVAYLFFDYSSVCSECLMLWLVNCMGSRVPVCDSWLWCNWARCEDVETEASALWWYKNTFQCSAWASVRPLATRTFGHLSDKRTTAEAQQNYLNTHWVTV